jgi:serine/threonine protein kinase
LASESRAPKSRKVSKALGECAIGQLLEDDSNIGPYKVINLIARGGMGEVYAASEPRLNRRVALKVLAKSDIPNLKHEEQVERFMNEARVLAQIAHPNVVTLYAVEEIGDVKVIVMEFVEGESLHEIFSRYVLSADEALPVMMQLLDGLAAMHRHNILHRDLKPSNLILRPDGTLKILDLGIAKQIGAGDQTATGIVMGTVNYLPPEVIYGSPATARSDLWSAGAIFYESLCGKNLAMAGQGNAGVEFPAETARWVQPEIRRIVSKLCARKVEDRFDSAEAVLKELEAFRRGRPAMQKHTLLALAKKVENLEEARRTIGAAIVSPTTGRRALAVSAILQQQSGERPAVSSDKTEAIAPGSTLRIENKTIQMALQQLSANKAPARPLAPIRMHDKSNSQSLFLMILIAAAAGFAGWKYLHQPAIQTAKASAPSIYSTSPGRFQLHPGENVQLSWSGPVASGYHLQISTDPQFLSLEYDQPATGKQMQIQRELADGGHQWRLSGAAGQPAFGPFPFTVERIEPIQPLAPLQDQKIDLGQALALTIKFAWRCRPDVHSYVVELTHDSKFQEAVGQQTVSECGFDSAGLAAGEYFWRVRPADASGWSETRHFTLNGTQAAADTPSAPTTVDLGLPQMTDAQRMEEALGENDELADEAAAPRGPASLDKPTLQGPGESERVPAAQQGHREPMEFTWSSVPAARSYRIEFSTDPAFSNPITRRSQKPMLRLPKQQFDAGRYNWRVRAERGERYSEWSAPATFEIIENH